MYVFGVLFCLLPMLEALPLDHGFTASLSTNILQPFENLGDVTSKKIKDVIEAKTPFLIPQFPDSGRTHAEPEGESLLGQLDAKYGRAQEFVTTLTGQKPLIDTIQEHEKYGNDGDKLRTVGTLVVAGYEGFSNVLNTAVQVPFDKIQNVGKRVTDHLNVIGGKLVGL